MATLVTFVPVMVPEGLVIEQLPAAGGVSSVTSYVKPSVIGVVNTKLLSAFVKVRSLPRLFCMTRVCPAVVNAMVPPIENA